MSHFDSPVLAAAYTKIREYRRQYSLLAPRERLMLLGAVVFLSGVLLYFVLVNPAINAAADAKQTLASKQALIQWMKSNESQVAQLRKQNGASSKPSSSQSFLALVNRSSGQYSVPLKRYEPEGQNKLRVWVEDVPFNGLISWLNELQAKNAINVVNISIDAQKDPGIISAKIILSL